MKNKFAIEVFYTNFYLHSAGTEKYILEQISELNRKDIDIVGLFPLKKESLGINLWGMIINEELVDVLTTEQIIRILTFWNSKGKILTGFFIHHLMNIDLNSLFAIINSLYECNIIVYLHDFYTACLQYNLLKNGKEYCGNAILEKNKCSSCSFFEKSIEHKSLILSFLLKINISHLFFIAPSKFMADTWIQAFPQFSDRLSVIGHLKFVGEYFENMNPIDLLSPLKVAFVGNQSYNKGWEFWIQAVDTLEFETHNYRFYYFGHSTHKMKHIQDVEVSVQKDGPTAMVDAIRKNGVDVVVLNSIQPETYSFTYYESLASNAFIITNESSGNISIQVRTNLNGIVMRSPDDLIEIFEKESNLRSALNEYRSRKRFGPLMFEPDLGYTKYLNCNSQSWIKPLIIHKHSNSILMRFITKLLYNARYKNMGQKFKYRSIIRRVHD